MFFERAALAPDDYSNLVNLNNNVSFLNFLEFFKNYNDRPISFFIIQLIHETLQGDKFYYLILLIFSSFSVLISVFIFFTLITRNIKFSFIITILYDLFPNKLETFHSSIFININFGTAIYIGTAIFFVLFLLKNNYTYLFLSYFFYLVSIFWYEVGFFMPLVFLTYLTIFYYSKITIIKGICYLTPFFIIMIFYTSFRLTGSFGHSLITTAKPLQLSAIPSGFIEIFNNYLGRYHIRSIIYGLYSFIRIPFNILFLTIILDLFLIIIFYNSIKKNLIKKVDIKIILLSISLFFFTIMPNLIYGGVGGRHTLLPTIGLILAFGHYMFSLQFKFRNSLISFFIFLAIIVSQGNTFSQVIALRIVNSFHDTIKENKVIISQSENLIFDLSSFKKNIKYSLVNNSYNNFNTYFGAQLFEWWGLPSMVTIVTKENTPKVFISSSPLIFENKNIKFNVSMYNGYKNIIEKSTTIPSINSFIVDYDLVYNAGYSYGNRGN